MTHGFPCRWAVIASTITLGDVPTTFIGVCIISRTDIMTHIQVVVIGFLSAGLL